MSRLFKLAWVIFLWKKNGEFSECRNKSSCQLQLRTVIEQCLLRASPFLLFDNTV